MPLAMLSRRRSPHAGRAARCPLGLAGGLSLGLTALATLAGCGARSALDEPVFEGPGVAAPGPEAPRCLTQGSWQPAADMQRPSVSHVLAATRDGAALAIGGQVDGSFATRIERFDPTSDEWREVGELPVGLLFHTATTLRDGRVLVVGGYDGALDGSGAGLTATWLVDPSTLGPSGKGGQGSVTVSPGPALPSGRYLHAATRLADGRVLVAGGYQQDVAVKGALLFDPDAMDAGAEAWLELDTPPELDGGYVALASDDEGAFAAAHEGVWRFALEGEGFSLVSDADTLGVPLLNVPRVGFAPGVARFVAVDTAGDVVVGDATTATLGPAPLWGSSDGEPPTEVLSLCEGAVVLARGRLEVSAVTGALLATSGESIARASGVVLRDGSLLVSGGATADASSVATSARYR